jgi:hypothetical protein
VLEGVEQPLGSRQPAAHRRHQRGVQEEVHRDANGSAGRPDRVAGLDAQRVGALPRLDRHVEVAGRVGDLGEQWQLGRTCKALRVRLHEKLVGHVPVASRGRFPRRREAHRAPP